MTFVRVGVNNKCGSDVRQGSEPRWFPVYCAAVVSLTGPVAAGSQVTGTVQT